MELLPIELRKNNYDYKQVKRTEKAAMYGQYVTGGELLIAYEVFLIREQKESDTVLGGKDVHYVNKELFPGDENFGINAWSFSSLQRAELCYKGLIKLNDGL